MTRRSALREYADWGRLGWPLSPITLSQIDIPEGQIRLIFNENPYGPSAKALEAVANILPKTAYYPGAIEQELPALFMERHRLDADQVFLASGSNEGLQAAMMAFGKQGKVISPSLTYSDHLAYAERLGIAVTRIPLARGYEYRPRGHGACGG